MAWTPKVVRRILRTRRRAKRAYTAAIQLRATKQAARNEKIEKQKTRLLTLIRQTNPVNTKLLGEANDPRNEALLRKIANRLTRILTERDVRERYTMRFPEPQFGHLKAGGTVPNLWPGALEYCINNAKSLVELWGLIGKEALK